MQKKLESGTKKEAAILVHHTQQWMGYQNPEPFVWYVLIVTDQLD